MLFVDSATVAVLLVVGILGGVCVGLTAYVCTIGWKRKTRSILIVAIRLLPVLLGTAMMASFILVGIALHIYYVALLEVVGGYIGWKVGGALPTSAKR
jgi:hypothetical protein